MSTTIRVYVKLPQPKSITGVPEPKSMVTVMTFMSEDNPTFFDLWCQFRHYMLCVSTREAPFLDLEAPLSTLADKRVYALHWGPSYSDLRTKLIEEWNRLERKALDTEIFSLERRLASAKRQRAQFDSSLSDEF